VALGWAAGQQWRIQGTGGGASTLQQVLNNGHVTGGTGIEFTAGDPCVMNYNAAAPGAVVPNQGRLWARNDGRLVWTDDAGVNTVLGIGGGGSLDAAYDYGGPGAGRVITADSGAVQINGAGGLRSAGCIVAGAVTGPAATEVLRVAGASRFEGDMLMAGEFDFVPATPSKGEIGTDALPFARVRANDIVAGDLHLKAPDGHADWTIKEEPSRLVASNNKTGKRYALALKEIEEE